MSRLVEIWVERNGGPHGPTVRYRRVAAEAAPAIAADLYSTGLFRTVEVWTGGMLGTLIAKWG